MEVCLICPPAPFLFEPKSHAPLGILYLAAVLEKAGHEVEIVDLRDAPEEGEWHIPDAEMYGIGFTTGDYAYAKKVAQKIRNLNPKALIVGGGPHPTSLPAETLKESEFDVVVIGEGEETIVELADAKPLPKTLGIVYEEGSKIRKNPARPLIQDLDSIPFPARHLAPLDTFRSFTLMDHYTGKGAATTIIASRGCPFNCSFCDVEMWRRKVRFRSPENVVAEIDEVWEKYGINHFRFLDDNITVNKHYLLKLCRLFESREVYWRAHTRSDIADLELFRAMYRGGCRELSFGIESGDQKILDLVNKGTTVERGKKAIQLAKRAGLVTKAYLIIGLPGENKETVEATKRFMREAKPDKYTLGVFVPLPGSDMFKNPEKYGMRIVTKDYSRYLLLGLEDSPDAFVYELNNSSRKELLELRDDLLSFLRSGEWKNG